MREPLARPVRHALARVAPDAWAGVFARYRELSAMPFVRAWAQAGHPLVVRRPGAGEPTPGHVPLGIATPPACGKERLALQMPAEDIVECTAPPALEDLLGSAGKNGVPSAWIEALRELSCAVSAVGVTCRVYGSLMWQCVTGIHYLSPASDVDLLWTLAPGQIEQLSELIEILVRFDRANVPRIDGEIIVADQAVCWRELARATSAHHLVLVKSDVAAYLCDRGTLFKNWGRAA